MIYRIVSILLIAGTVSATGIIAAPVKGGQTADTSRITASSNSTFEGLLAVKEADGVFLVRAEDGKKKRFTVNRNTMITRNGKPVDYSDLRSRDRVRVHYNSDFLVTEIQASGS